MFGEEYKLWSSSLCSFLQSPVIYIGYTYYLYIPTWAGKAKSVTLSRYELESRGSSFVRHSGAQPVCCRIRRYTQGKHTQNTSRIAPTSPIHLHQRPIARIHPLICFSYLSSPLKRWSREENIFKTKLMMETEYSKKSDSTIKHFSWSQLYGQTQYTPIQSVSQNTPRRELVFHPRIWRQDSVWKSSKVRSGRVKT
jgi:hypothetical protein